MVQMTRPGKPGTTKKIPSIIVFISMCKQEVVLRPQVKPLIQIIYLLVVRMINICVFTEIHAKVWWQNFQLPMSM